MAKILLFLIIIIHSFVLTKIIFFPYPELFIYPYLTNHGLKPYAQILDQHFPGLMFLPVNFDNLGMTNETIARGWLISIVVITHLLLFLISNHVFKNRYKALLVNILFLVWQPFFEGWILWIDSFLPLILLPCFYVFIKRKFFLTGLLLGISIVFKQVLIPLSVLILLYIFWKEKRFKNVLEYLTGLLVPIILVIAYFWAIGVLRDFWYWTVVFNLTTYAQFGRGTGPTLAHFSRVFLVFGLPFLIVRKIKSKEAQILLIFLIGTLIGLFTRFDFVHFQPALPFALLATVYVLGWLGGLGRAGIISLYSLILIWWLVIFYKGHLGDRVISFDPDTKNLAEKIKGYTRPSEKIFVYGATPHLYQMSGTLPAGDIFVFQFPWFLQVAKERILAGIEKDRPEIIVSNRTVQIERNKLTDFTKEIDRYISKNYEKIDGVGDTEILRKK
ncbi:hypothetical protein A3H40_02530 [Candidatus Daviesbacteria bacterium RIFCSPLOWO2_02_FULL_38_15]|uniref:Glycosyltransferase RgtA/B/C/D-like domain-containing protein n=1 Tax=Candidatus Daviesbacteria bacterium RIFCSPLOWO2_02_FULL_38_15 TaxID=1797794 RepID=A0A1F5N3U8_9BACT|nr:MAG: hypothetical protein A3H40_02530 [Candidatus Daviesbacteria bacterium RIFCSPLOWO2_02_FULL_38_15]